MSDITPQTDETVVDVAANLADIRERMRLAAVNAGRDPAATALVAVSKQQPVERAEAALAAGQRVFGENYVQAAQAVWPALRERHGDVELHMIGPLQTNKAEQAVNLFDVIQSLDRPKLAGALAKAMDRTGRRPRLLVQVNTGEEPQKAGILPADADAFIRDAVEIHQLPVDGLMAIPPADEDISLHAALLCRIAERNGLAIRSVGMSEDFETAIRFGSTMVRVGSAIFGARMRRT
ncbi:MAG: YggS family pyridoxal phosphate-dependent enzyme [Geminicoccaceae bacterium]